MQQAQNTNTSIIQATGNWSWTVSLSNLRGKVIVKIDTISPWRPKESKLVLYEGTPPTDPSQTENVAWTQYWAGPYDGYQREYDTGKDWGPGWSAALVALDGGEPSNDNTGKPYYVCKTEETIDNTEK